MRKIIEEYFTVTSDWVELRIEWNFELTVFEFPRPDLYIQNMS